MGIFDPKNRSAKSAQNPQSGGGNQSITRQVINAIFGRTPLFYNAGLGDVISPIVDSSLYYPLVINTAFQEQNPVSTGSFVWSPPTNKHWMVSFLNTNIPHVPPTGVTIDLILTIPNAINIVLSNNLLPASTTIQPVFPLIGGFNSEVDVTISPTAEPIFLSYTGIKSVYLNSSMSLIVRIVGSAGGDVLRSQIVYLELPENQPFGPAITI